MDDALLQADCSRCAGLCCVAYPFDRSEEFAFDKAGDEPCRHLTRSFQCGIHAQRAQRGFSGCARYDCFGAGQRITDIYEGRNWRDSPEQGAEMLEVFRILRRVHELLMLLRAAGKLSLPRHDAQRLQAFETALAPKDGWTAASLLALEIDATARNIRTFLASLKDHVGR